MVMGEAKNTKYRSAKRATNGSFAFCDRLTKELRDTVKSCKKA